MQPRAILLSILTLVFACNTLWAGGSGLNVMVVVNQNSTNSVQLGNDYCELRGVPPQNVLRITNWTGGSINWSPVDFQNYLQNPLLAAINARSLAQQVQFVVLSMDIPYRVTDGYNQNSTTAVLFYGFKTNGTPVSGIGSCSLPDNTSNSYAYSELPFSQALPNTALTNSFLAMMLTDTNLATAENTLRRGVSSDFTCPTQTVYLAKTSDTARNVRYLGFDNSVFENQVVSNYAVTRINTDSTAFTNLAGFQTGLASYTFNTNAFEPGALGDTLTSFAGEIFENSGQTPLLAFLEAGASGSYGTVVEPCNYPQKFPDPVDYFYQTRGFTLAEAYYQSVLNPFEGLFVGEPLAAPFAHPGLASWSSLTNGMACSGVITISPTFTNAAATLPLSQVDLFVDGTFYQTMTNLPPCAGNVLTVVLNGTSMNYTVPANATLATVASGLAAVLNLQSNVTQVIAFPLGDRIELQSQQIYVPGASVSATASSAAGAGSALTTDLNTARPVFLDTVAIGFQYVTFNNAPMVGDWMQATIMKTNGITVTLGVTNTVSGTTVGAMTQSLVNEINANATLQAADGVMAGDFFDADQFGQASAQFFLYARASGLPAAQILATWTTSTNLQSTPTGMNPLTDNSGDISPKDHLYVSSGAASLAVDFPLNTTQLSDGYHQLTAVAYEGTSVATQTRVTRTILVQNTNLSATFTALPVGTNVNLGQTLQFSIAANSTNIARIELFGTGGSLAVVTNHATAVFNLSPSYLGFGLHPFYALVTDTSGNHYQTQTLYYRIAPTFNLTLNHKAPFSLSWSAIPPYPYNVQFTTNLLSGFQTIATITATNAVMQWPVTATNSPGFYRVQWQP